MSRRRAAEKREINPDPNFGDKIVAKFMNSLMLDGKKSVSETIVYGALDMVAEKTKKEAINFFHNALCDLERNENINPELYDKIIQNLQKK